MAAERMSRGRLVASGLVPFVFVILMVAYLLGPGSELIDLGTPLPEITLEQISFVDTEIHVIVRNTGPIPVDVVIADVNDRIQPAAIEPDKHLERFETALVRIPFAWNEAEPYTIGLTTHDGTRFEKFVEAAVSAPKPDVELFGFFALIGTFVGIIPVMIGLLWLPFIKNISRQKYLFFLSLTVGLLLFLGLDATEEAIDVSNQHLSANFNGLLLISTIIVLSFFALYYTANKLSSSAGVLGISKPLAVALMISIGIGLHNLGEGLAIGAAVGLGQIALSTFLIVGFALHNTTEGIAIASPLAKTRSSIPVFVGLGLIAGVPAIFGAWIGGFFYSPLYAVIFLSVGVGAILQVMVLILQWIKTEGDGTFSSISIAAGISIGVAAMYLTSIIL